MTPTFFSPGSIEAIRSDITAATPAPEAGSITNCHFKIKIVLKKTSYIQKGLLTVSLKTAKPIVYMYMKTFQMTPQPLIKRLN